jgi:SAM-dependent methyltransferase
MQFAPIANSGYCHCCRSNTIFQSEQEWLRDNYVCLKCRSIPRQRHLQMVLDRYFVGWEKSNVHESSVSNDFLSKYCAQYSTSQYFADVAPGATNGDGEMCQNLEGMSFADNTFDLFITQDVFEHVFDPASAAREVMRVLKPGGAHVFTAPKHRDLVRTHARAKLEVGKVVNIMPEVYHGNPVGGGRALVTWDYGSDFEHLFSGWCGYPMTTYLTKDRTLGLDGEFLEVFVVKKF